MFDSTSVSLYCELDYCSTDGGKLHLYRNKTLVELLFCIVENVKRIRFVINLVRLHATCMQRKYTVLISVAGPAIWNWLPDRLRDTLLNVCFWPRLCTSDAPRKSF